MTAQGAEKLHYPDPTPSSTAISACLPYFGLSLDNGADQSILYDMGEEEEGEDGGVEDDEDEYEEDRDGEEAEYDGSQAEEDEEEEYLSSSASDGSHSSRSIDIDPCETDLGNDANELLEDVSYHSLAGPQAKQHAKGNERLPHQQNTWSQASFDSSQPEVFVPPTGDEGLQGRQNLSFERGKRGARRGRGIGRARGGRGGRPSKLNEAPSDYFSWKSRTRRGRPRGEGLKGGEIGAKRPKRLAEPTEDFKELQLKATTAYLWGAYEEAAEHATKAVRNNPEIFAAHSLLAQILFSKGNVDESLEVLWASAHTRKETSAWWEVATRTLEYRGDRTPETLNKVLYCYSNIVKLDPKDYDARKGKLEILLELDYWLQAVHECEGMLRLRPYDLEVLQTFSEKSLLLNAVQNAKIAYERALKHYKRVQRDSSDGNFSFSDLNIYLEVYARLKQWREGIVILKSTARWLSGRKDESCWKGFHENDCEWDIADEPRRIKVPGYRPTKYPIAAYGQSLPLELRAKLGIFRLRLGPLHFQEALHHFSHFDLENSAEDGPVYEVLDLFKDIADALEDEGHFTEALEFYESRHRSKPQPELVTCKKMGSCYHRAGHLFKAIEYYKTVLKKDQNDVDTRLRLAEAYEEVGQPNLAYTCATKLVQQGRKDLVRNARLPVTRQLIDDMGVGPSPLTHPNWTYSSKLAAGLPPGHSSLFALNHEDEAEESAFSRLTTSRSGGHYRASVFDSLKSKASLQTSADEFSHGLPFDQAPDLKSLHQKLQKLTHSVRAGHEHATSEWMRIAETLVSEFIRENVSFPHEGDITNLDLSELAQRTTGSGKTGTLSRSEAGADTTELFRKELETLATEHASILYSDWLAIFGELALHQARRGHLEAAYVTLGAAINANDASHNMVIIGHLQHVQIACALLLRDADRLSSIARWFIREHPLASDPYRLYAALHRICATWPGAYDAAPFTDRLNQKFLMQRIKLQDFRLLPTQHRARLFTETEMNSFGSVSGQPQQIRRSGSTDETSTSDLTEPDPVLLYLQGNLLLGGGPLTGPLNFYLRAYAAQKDNALVVLSIAVVYVQYAMRRKDPTHRHFHVLQGVGWFGEYRRVRLASRSSEAEERKRRRIEVEFNEGRLYHGLGLNHLAMPAYLRCLKIAQEDEAKGFDDKTGRGSGLDSNAAGATEDDRDGEAITLTETGAERVTVPDFTREAAYALQLMLAMGGDIRAARAIGEKWLVF